MFFVCPNAKGPHGHDNEELSSSPSCYFVSMLQVTEMHNNEDLSSLLSCIFLFKCCKSPRPRQRKVCHPIFFNSSDSSARQQGSSLSFFFVLVIQVRWVFYLFFGVGKKFVLFCVMVFCHFGRCKVE
jgi:hypothetical protein